MIRLTLFVAFVVFANGELLSSQRGEDLPAYYDAETGNLTIDTTNVFNGAFLGYVLEPGSGVFRPENHTPIMNTPAFATANEGFIGETNFEGIDGGVYSLGDILPAGLSFDEIRDDYFGVDVFGQPGLPGVNPNLNYYVTGPAGSDTFHLLDPVYSASPHVPLNDNTIGPATVDRWATQVTLLYDNQSGNLAIDSTGENGGAIISYELRTAEPSFDIGSFTPLGTLRPLVTEDTIAEVVFAGISEGIHSLGPILQPGLSIDEVSDLLTTTLFIGEPNHSVGALDVNVSGIEMSLAVVPEPHNVLPLILLMLFVFHIRRK